MATYKIEEVAKMCGLTKRTIRYYEEIGLLFPPERSEGGYRLYSEKHVERLKQILNARDVLGSSLQELQEYIAVIEEFQQLRQGIHEIREEKAKLEKLEGLERTIGLQLTMIDQKLEKLTGFRAEVMELNDRVQEAKRKIISHQE
uniref:MerR family transcriptional regulator n=2 Tax=Cohnella candidum TaxID=2674991 RepID=A0A3G3JZ33_9BACL|nr:MerR family transcriptional regulator [Cohnella candidum]AYQ73412.1 MerR family transcriptional regulator [Cohnella candidum]